jgi:hypothetical protein
MARNYMEKMRGKRSKLYSKCSKDQQQQDRAWLLATAQNKHELMHMVADVLNASSRVEAHELVHSLLLYADENVVHSCRTFIEQQRNQALHDSSRNEKRELDVDLALALFFELDLSWHHYHVLTHVWRVSTDRGDMRLPSKRALYQRYLEAKTVALQQEVPLGPDQGCGSVCVRSPESGLQAVVERVQGVADDSAAHADGVFERFLEQRAPVELTMATDGFTVPDFTQKSVSYLQANVRVGVPGARSLGYLSSHIPLLLGRCPETYDVYRTVWPLVEAPFLKDGQAIKSITINWKGAPMEVPVEFKMSNDLKSTLMLLGRQGVRGRRPCPCCRTERKRFGCMEELFRPERSLRRISAKHHCTIKSLHQPEPALDGRTVMSLIAEETQAVEEADCGPLAGALLDNAKIVSFLADAGEVKALQEDGAIGTRAATFVELSPGQPLPVALASMCNADECAQIMDCVLRWSTVCVGAEYDHGKAQEKENMLWFMTSKSCCVVEECDGFVWYWCRCFPSVEYLCENKTRATSFLKGMAMNFTRPSLSKLIVDPASQIVMEVLHCVLNLVRSHFESLKLMCNQYFRCSEGEGVDGGLEKVPVVKTPAELAAWDKHVRQDNSTARGTWRANGWVLEDDLERLLGFREPMMGYHGNQCFALLSKWEDICGIPVLQQLDGFLSGYTSTPVPEEHSRLRQWLSNLDATCKELKRTRPCVAVLEQSIRGWFSVLCLLQEHESKLYTCKTYDHFCCVHLVPMVLRFGNLIQHATFGTEHDNSVIRRDVRAHTTGGGGRYGGDSKASDLLQLFDRRCVMRSDAVIRKNTWSREWRVLPEGGACSCEACCSRFSVEQEHLPPPPPPPPPELDDHFEF